MEAALRDELRVALRQRGLPARGLKEDLFMRLLRARRAGTDGRSSSGVVGGRGAISDVRRFAPG